MVVEHEGHSAQHHENDRDPVEIGVSIMGHAGIFWRKTCRGHRAESMADRIKPVHSPKAKQKDIDPVDDRVKNP